MMTQSLYRRIGKGVIFGAIRGLDLMKMVNSQMMISGVNNGRLTSTSSSSSGLSNQMMMPDTAKMQSMIIGGSLLSHKVYCAVLVAVVTVLIISIWNSSIRKRHNNKLEDFDMSLPW